jgi:hypothetical protein
MSVKNKRVEKRHVLMMSVVEGVGTVQMEDYVPLEMLDNYVADAKTRWAFVVVPQPEVHNPGPGGDEGETADLSHLK